MNARISTDSRRRCPHCHQTSMESFFQQALAPGKQGKWYVHCSNPDCTGHKATLSPDEYQTRFADRIES